ncbi:MAG: exodeoxyribonuclease VII small subunit [Phycisphaerae bacterium]
MADKKHESFNLERTMEELGQITEKISSGKVGLEESLQLFERGMQMVNQCREYLAEAENRIKVISEESTGRVIKEKSVNELKGR